MTTTVQMNIGNGRNGTVSLPFPSSSGPLTAANGVVTVNSEDVPLALCAGWTLMTTWQQAAIRNDAAAQPGATIIPTPVTPGQSVPGVPNTRMITTQSA